MSMTIDDARRTIRSAQTTDPNTVNLGDLVMAAITLCDRANQFDLEIDCERARWAAATADRPMRRIEPLARFTEMSAALDTVRSVEQEPSLVEDPRELIDACGIALDANRLLEYELQEQLARWPTASSEVQNRRVNGHELLAYGADYGPPHNLADAEVQPGDTLYLLSHAGWIPGQFRRPLHEPLFSFGLPGVANAEVCIRIPPGARFTWPVWHHVARTGPNADVFVQQWFPRK